MSCFAPAWVKTNSDRFPRVRTSKGESEEILTPFSTNALGADQRAFVALMRHLKDIDTRQHTVIMIQVENEVGMLPDARDHSAAADSAFAGPVPAKLMTYLAVHREELAPELRKRWIEQGAHSSGNWEEVFGKGPATDELFMSWYFGCYVNSVASAGKTVFPLPMYANAALNAPGRQPGQYPSAGPLPHVMDIWKAAAPGIDFLAPDFYNPDFSYWCDRYTRSDNVLFIPEHRLEPGVDAKAFFAFGHYHAIGFSPFSIESPSNPAIESLSKAYDILEQLQPVISATKDSRSMDGFLIGRETDTSHLEMGDYLITVAHDYTLGWSPGAKEDHWPITGGLIISLSKDEFYVAGTGVVLTFRPRTPGLHAGILRIDEGNFVDGKWKPGRRLNGDQDHQGRHLRIPVGEYGIQRIKLYTYP